MSTPPLLPEVLESRDADLKRSEEERAAGRKKLYRRKQAIARLYQNDARKADAEILEEAK